MFGKNKYINIFRILLGLGILAMGFIILSNPQIKIYTVATLLGIAVVLQGGSLILDSSYKRNKNFYSLTDLSLGGVFIAFGIIIMIDTNIDFFLLGIFVIFIASVSFLRQLMVCYEKRNANQKYGISIAFGIVHLIFAILTIYSIANEGTLLHIFIGAYLLNLGILVITALGYKRNDSE